jgi:hypothetical protein
VDVDAAWQHQPATGVDNTRPRRPDGAVPREARDAPAGD